MTNRPKKPAGWTKTKPRYVASLVLTTSSSILLIVLSHPSHAGSSPRAGSGGSRPEFARFRSWALSYIAQAPGDAKAKQKLIAQGRVLAKQRRAAFVELIKSDPAQALASTLPYAMRKRLPAEILSELEMRVSGIGDFLPMAIDRAPGGPLVEPIQRFVRLNQQTYRAYVDGRRTWQTTKYGIPLHGVAVDGVLALAETSVRELEPEEACETTQRIVNLANLGSAVNGTPVLAEMGGTIYRFVSRQHLLDAEAKLEAAERGIGPKPKQSARRILEFGVDAPRQETPAPPNTWTLGNKQFLVIRVDFSDLPGDPVGPWWNPTTYTAPVAQDYLDTQVSPFFVASSYGRTSLTNTVTPQLYRMPRPAEYYATAPIPTGFLELIADAETAASADYNISGYDRIAALSSFLGDIPGSHLGASGGGIGSLVIHVSGDLTAVVHELGHTYGLFHANLWQVNDGNPVSSSGVDTDYGDRFDVMGGAILPDYNIDLRAHFNPWFKNILEWITDSQVQTATADGVYRINRFDTAVPAAGRLALKIPRDVTRNYWVGCRRGLTDNASLQNGAYIVWGYHQPQQSDLLDMTTPGNSDTDSALAVGSTFTDPDEQISIEVVDQGGSGDAQYIDVRVTIRSRTVVGAPLNSDPGWTRQGEWAFGVPTGQGGTFDGYPDPTSGATGTNVFGVNLNGDFSTAVGGPYYLIGGPFDFTGYIHSKLQFARWLNSDFPPRFTSTVDVSSNGTTWTPVWAADWSVTDSHWTQQLYDISAVADNQSTVFVRWGYNMTEPGNPYSGWNIDDIELNALPLSAIPTPTPTPTPTGTPSSSTTLKNISTRLNVLAGDQVLIGGFVITGSDPKSVLIRGIGPSLTGVGVTLIDPTLELHQGGSTVTTNDNWKTRPNGTSQQADIEATTIPPTDDLESAILASLSPGAYTAILAGKNGGIGVGLVEVYDLGQGADSRLANISTRGFVDTGNNVMIGGFIIGGGSGGDATRVMVRALGPSLTESGVAGALGDSTLELHDGSGTTIATNDNWKTRPNGTSQQAEIEATTIPPTNDLESALVQALPPGNYTAIVRGNNNTTGVGLVEAYDLQ